MKNLPTCLDFKICIKTKYRPEITCLILLLGQCTNCPGAEAVVKDIEILLKTNSIASVTYKKWVQTDR